MTSDFNKGIGAVGGFVENIKSGIQNNTPRMMERDMEKAIEEHTKHILEVQEYLWAY